MLLEEGVDLEAAFEAEHAADFGFREALGAVAFEGESFEDEARKILPFSDDLLGKLVRDVDADFHSLRIAQGVMRDSGRFRRWLTEGRSGAWLGEPGFAGVGEDEDESGAFQDGLDGASQGGQQRWAAEIGDEGAESERQGDPIEN